MVGAIVAAAAAVRMRLAPAHRGPRDRHPALQRRARPAGVRRRKENQQWRRRRWPRACLLARRASSSKRMCPGRGCGCVVVESVSSRKRGGTDTPPPPGQTHQRPSSRRPVALADPVSRRLPRVTDCLTSSCALIVPSRASAADGVLLCSVVLGRVRELPLKGDDCAGPFLFPLGIGLLFPVILANLFAAITSETDVRSASKHCPCSLSGSSVLRCARL